MAPPDAVHIVKHGLTSDNWIAISSAVLTGLGLCWAITSHARTLRQGNQFKRAEWLLNLTFSLHKEPALEKLFNEIQYKKFKFTAEVEPTGDLGTAREMELIYWLDFLNAIGAGVQEGIMDLDYLRSCTLGYAIEMTMNDPAIDKYLEHVAVYDLRRKSLLKPWFILKYTHQSFHHLRWIDDKFRDFDRKTKHR